MNSTHDVYKLHSLTHPWKDCPGLVYCDSRWIASHDPTIDVEFIEAQKRLEECRCSGGCTESYFLCHAERTRVT